MVTSKFCIKDRIMMPDITSALTSLGNLEIIRDKITMKMNIIMIFLMGSWKVMNTAM